jgi:hypothetical protein
MSTPNKGRKPKKTTTPKVDAAYKKNLRKRPKVAALGGTKKARLARKRSSYR